jgi:hypothetical protein
LSLSEELQFHSEESEDFKVSHPSQLNHIDDT